MVRVAETTSHSGSLEVFITSIEIPEKQKSRSRKILNDPDQKKQVIILSLEFNLVFQFQFYLLILFASQSQTLPFCFWDASELIQFIFAPLLQGRAASTSPWNYHCPAWVRLLLLCFLLFVRFCTKSSNAQVFERLKLNVAGLASGVVLKPWPNPCLHVWSQQNQQLRQLQPAAPIPPIPLVLAMDIRYQLAAGCSYHIVRVLRLTESIKDWMK